MRAPEKRRIIREVCRAIPGLYQQGVLAAAIPRGRILRGVFLDSSQDPDVMYAVKFVQPLYVPLPHLTWSLGDRLLHPTKGWGWGRDDVDVLIEVIRNDAEQFYRPISTPEALADWDEVKVEPKLHYHSFSRAYSLIACDRPEEALQALNGLIGFMDEQLAVRPDDIWERLRDQATMMAALAEHDLARAQEQLRVWEQETARALRVEDIP